MARFELTFPATITILRGGEATPHLAPWSGGALLQDLLAGERSFLAHVDALPPAPAFVACEARATIDVDARRLSIERDVGDLERAPALRRAYRRALCAAWPGWEWVEREPLRGAAVSMSLLRALPEGAPGRAWITHVAADGATRDVDVGVDVEEALSLGPPLREALAGRPAVALAREAAIIDGLAQAPCSSGALVDDRRRRIEVWWSAPTATRRAVIEPLARLWPGMTVVVHDLGLPGQIAGSGRDPAAVRVDDAEAEALLDHVLRVERWFDPTELQARALAALGHLEAAGVPVVIPAAARARTRPSARLDDPRAPSPPRERPLPLRAPELHRLVREIHELDAALARGQGADGLRPSTFWGPPAWVAIVDHSIERELDRPARLRLVRWLAPQLRLDIAAADDDALLAGAREALLERARRAPPYTRFFGWDTEPTS
ncbi:MAG: hypothetical protein H6711_11040 [Myxococcales bacterium]|nr:hypothetical protein [Myxococcales bacterium]